MVSTIRRNISEKAKTIFQFREFKIKPKSGEAADQET